MLGWGWVTRRSVVGLGLGLLSAAALAAVSTGIGLLAAYLLGLPLKL
jgi:hypothetical protein